MKKRKWLFLLLIIPLISTLDIWISIAAIAKKGPKGIKLSLLLKRIYIATGKAIKVAKNISHIAKGYPITIPNKNINLISPPPILSLLNNLSPINFITYIVTKARIPAKILLTV